MLKKRVGGEDSVVWLNNSCGDLWGWINCESKLRFLSIVNRESFKEKRSESGTSSSSDCVEYKEALQTCALIRQLSDSV